MHTLSAAGPASGAQMENNGSLTSRGYLLANEPLFLPSHPPAAAASARDGISYRFWQIQVFALLQGISVLRDGSTDLHAADLMQLSPRLGSEVMHRDADGHSIIEIEDEEST